MRKTGTRVVSWLSVLAMLLTMVAVSGLALPMTATADTVLFSENFDSYANGVLPDGWTISSDSGYTDITVQNGALTINGRGSDSQTRVLYTGSELMNQGNYVFEADYTILEADYALDTSTRYSGMIFRADANLEPYYYVTTRVRMNTSQNELSIRNSASSFKKIAEAVPPANQALNTTYHLKVVCNGANIKFYIDDALVFNKTLEISGTNYSYLSAGTIGFTTSNMKVTFDNITVSEVPTTAVGATLFSENFDSYANGVLPDGWLVSSDSGYTSVSVQNGALQINGNGTDLQTRILYLGSELADKSDYVFEADYTIVDSPTALTSSTRYSSMIFRANPSIYPYYYVTTRVKPGTDNELSIRNNSSSGSYKQLALADAPAQQVLGQTYHLKVVCRGANVQYYIDDTLVFNYTLETSGTNYSYLDKGTIGFTTSNMTVSFDNIVVSEATSVVAAQPALYDTYVPTTNIINPPSVITNVKNADVYATLTGDKLPSTTLYYLNKDMKITTPDGATVIATLADALTKTNGKVIPALYIKDNETARALYDFTIEAALQDAFIVADDPAVLKFARDLMPNLYGVLYAKLTTAATEADLAAMVANTNIGWGKTVMVDAQYVSKDDVAYMQKRLMNVWVIGDLTPEQKYENIYKGVNGIVDTDHAGTYWIYENTNGIFNSSSDTTPIMIREPFIYAHRGYSAVAAQNTMAAFYAAVDYGADLIEMDVRLTSDGVVVIYHDEYLYTLTDCTDQTKKVENVTYEELMTYNVTTEGHNEKIATLREFLELIDQTDGIVGIIEIKNYDMNLVDKSAAMVKEMGMEDKVVSICFGKAYCERMREQLPGVSVGWLANSVAAHTTAEAIINYAKGWVMAGNLSYHPNFGQFQNSSTNALVANAIEKASQRGLSFNPWTYNGAAAFDTAYVNGIQGITTDFLNYDNNYVRKIEAGATYQIQEGVPTAVQVHGFTSQDDGLYNAIVKRSGGAAITFTNSNGMVTASGTGAASAVLMYKVTTNYAGSYYVISDLITINVTAEGGTNATAEDRITLLPQYAEKWQNNMAGMNIDVTRDGRGEVLLNTTGSWPSVSHTIAASFSDNAIAGVTASLDDYIGFEMLVGGKLSLIITLSDGTTYQVQKYMSDVTLDGEDLVGNGKTVIGKVKLGDMIPASSATNGKVTITAVKVFNIGDAGCELIIRNLDVIRVVPAMYGLVGDVNTDGAVETADVRLIINSAIGTASLNYKQVAAGDVNYDNYVNSSDARDILKNIVLVG